MEILYESTILLYADWMYFCPLLVFISLMDLILFTEKRKVLKTIFLFSLFFSSIGFFIYGLTFGRVKEKCYEVSFHEPIDMNEFLDKYEIIQVHGHIVKIKEK